MVAEQRYAYIGIEAECGHVTFACVDDPTHRADTGREIAKAVRRGQLIEHVTVEEARSRLTFNCDCLAKARKAKRETEKAERDAAMKRGPLL